IEAVLDALEGAQSAATPQETVVVSLVKPLGMISSVAQEEREFAFLKNSFKDDFQKCFAQIKLLSGREEIHDQLHELELKFYIPVLQSLPDVPTSIDGQLLDIVRDHYFILSEI